MKEVGALVRKLRKKGCTVERTGSGHLKVTVPSGEVLFEASTPSDRRSLLNTKARLRRAGIEL